MENWIHAANEFKNLNISRADLQTQIGKNLLTAKLEEPITVTGDDLIVVLKRYKAGDLSLDKLLDWVNVIWFTDLYAYAEKQQEAIASVMSELEELDEEGQSLTPEQIDQFVTALAENREYTG